MKLKATEIDINELKVIRQMCRNVLAKVERLSERVESASAPRLDKRRRFEEEVANEKARILTGNKFKKA